MNPELLTVVRDVNSPPGGWKYTVPETGVTITGQFYNVLKPRVIAHLRANGLPVDEDVIEHGACVETRPPGSWCAKRQPKPVEGKLPHLTLAHLDRFIKSIWGTLVSRDFVSREEAERRAEVCRTCPLISGGLGGCSGCYTLLRATEKLVQKNPIKMDEDKDVCGACGCHIPLLVWCKNSTLDKAAGERMPKYQEGVCWRLDKDL
jgi:hypothetical protein